MRIKVSGPANSSNKKAFYIKKTTVFIIIFWGGDKLTFPFPFYSKANERVREEELYELLTSPKCPYWLNSLLGGFNSSDQNVKFQSFTRSKVNPYLCPNFHSLTFPWEFFT